MSEQIDTFAKALAESRSARLTDEEAEAIGNVAAYLSKLLTGPEDPGIYWGRINLIASIAYDRALGIEP